MSHNLRRSRAIFSAVLFGFAMCSAASELRAADWPDGFAVKTQKLEDGTDYEYLLMSPAEVEAGKQYPLVLFLHGAGERGDNLKKVLKHFPEVLGSAENRQKFPCFLIVPQCPSGQRWVDVDWSRNDPVKQPRQPSQPMKNVIEVLQASMKTLPVDQNRVYLTGLSMGGYGSWDLGTRHPEWFAAVVPICGAGDLSTAARLKNVPVWTAHGTADRIIPAKRTQRMVAALKEAGVDVTYQEYEGVGHNSWEKAYRSADGAIPWMFKQRRKSR